MDKVLFHLKSPFKAEWVTMAVPSHLCLRDLRRSVELATELAAVLPGSESVPELFVRLPLDSIGQTALMLLGRTMPDEMADGVEGEMLVGMLSAHAFVGQLLDKIRSNQMLDRAKFISRIKSLREENTEHLTAALTLLLSGCNGDDSMSKEQRTRLDKLSRLVLVTLDSFETHLQNRILEDKAIQDDAPAPETAEKSGESASEPESLPSSPPSSPASDSQESTASEVKDDAEAEVQDEVLEDEDDTEPDQEEKGDAEDGKAEDAEDKEEAEEEKQDDEAEEEAADTDPEEELAESNSDFDEYEFDDFDPAGDDQ
jgi:hypothetical protein